MLWLAAGDVLGYKSAGRCTIYAVSPLRKRRPGSSKRWGAEVFRSRPDKRNQLRPFRRYRRPRTLVIAASSVALAIAWVPAIAPAASAATSIVVSLNFDNNVANEFYLGFQDALQPAGVGATYYINSGTIGTSNKLSWSQVSSLAAAGDDIGGKTVDGTNLTTLTSQQQISEICNDRQNITSHGITPITFAYPSGPAIRPFRARCRAAGTGTPGLPGSLSPTGATYAESLPPRSWLALRAYAPSGQVTLSNLESLVSGAASHGGGWIPIVIQRVCSATLDQSNYSNCTASAGWIDLGDLQTFISWVQGAGQSGDAPTGTAFQTMGATAKAADTSAPTTTISCNGSPCQSAPTARRLRHPRAGRPRFGIASTHYTLDGTTPTLSSPTYTGQVPLTGTTTVEFRHGTTPGTPGRHRRKSCRFRGC